MIKIDKEKCLGCGACVSACKKGFELKDGKAEVKSANVSCIKQDLEVYLISLLSI
ncbi:MAG: ferredoxin [Nanoarchaeota archaeon]|nr:ferredoxin [Nanoarchaeota archaeon]MBU1028415.1 ferredoxin [Nanoarchaeota archaeon]